MQSDLLALAVLLWLIGAVAAAAFPRTPAARWLLTCGCLAGIAGTLAALPDGMAPTRLPFGIADQNIEFRLDPAAAWLLFFGLAAAACACWLGTPSREGRAAWAFGIAGSLVGALGVLGTQDAMAFLISWELMSLGAAVALLGERLADDHGKPVLFMLALLEVGTVALVAAFLILADTAHSTSFAAFSGAARSLSEGTQVVVGLLLLVGFGAKLGLLPFYEWFPGAYGAGSGATGAVMSGVVLNAAYFGLGRGLVEWLPAPSGAGIPFLGYVVIVIAVASSVLAALYAFQQESWRGLLSFSSAENGSIAVALLGAALIFMRDGLTELAALAWLVALLHLAGHALAKGGMFLAADAVFHATSRYEIQQAGHLRRGPWMFGLGALFSAMSLAAMPPQAGFVSEWYLFQTVFQGFHLHDLGSRLVLAFSGAALAITVAVALATFVKVLGIGLLGHREAGVRAPAIPVETAAFVCLLGVLVLALAVGMPWWLASLTHAVPGAMNAEAAHYMRDGWLLVPLTAKFAFISPSKLVIAMPVLALVPIALIFLTRRGTLRRAPVWYGGREQDPRRASTTALAFSNALRTFYSFVYRPTATTTRELPAEAGGYRYFLRRLTFTHDVVPVFGPFLFVPLTRAVVRTAARLRSLQSGHLNFYLALIGILLVAILAVTFL